MGIFFTHLDTHQTETTESFFSSEWLNARIDSGNETSKEHDIILEENRDEEWKERHWKEIKANELEYEEDVNQYITLALAEMVHPRSLEWINQYILDWNSDVGQRVERLQETTQQYFIYKVNADFLLLKLGLFPLEPQLPEDAYFEKGNFYYSCAANTLKKSRKGRDALSDVLEKLAAKFSKYVEILRYMKNHSDNYLSFYNRIPEIEFQGLQSVLTQEVQKNQGLS